MPKSDPHKTRPTFCIIDASSFIFRAYYAVRPLSNKSGLPTNAVFGFAQMILSVLEQLKPEYIAVVYDTKYPSFRKEMYPEYKANRSDMPDDLVPQMPYIKRLVEAMGLPGFEQPGFEADDIIATFADQAAHRTKEAEVIIVSSDKDLLQLVNEHVVLFDTMKNKRLGPAEVIEKMGVPPEQVPDYLGIVGDASDNIPGVKGIGPKGAEALLKEFGSVENIYKNLDKIKKETQRRQLEESRDNALLSKKLATVKRDMKLSKDWHELHCRPHFSKVLGELLNELEFTNLHKRLQNLGGAKADASEGEINTTTSSDLQVREDSTVKKAANPNDVVLNYQPKYRSITSLEQLKAAFAGLSAQQFIAIDTETTSLHIRDLELVGFSFCGNKHEAFYVPVAHKEGTQCNRGEALCLFAGFLSDKKIIGQNLKFDLNVLRKFGVEIKASQLIFDPMLGSFLLDPESRHNLDFLADRYLGHKNISFEDLCGSGKDQITFDNVEIEKATQYAAEDAHVAFLLAEVIKRELFDVSTLKTVFEKIDLPLEPVLADMEWEGIAVDKQLLRNMSEEFAGELTRLEKQAYTLADEEFNLASPKQLQKILFEKLNLPVIKKTKTGFSTDVEVLEKLVVHHELPKLILEHRELSKLKSTYVDVLPEIASQTTGRVHTSFHQTVAATGRLSSSDPNLQNIPIRTESGRRIRKAFIARPNYELIGADYSQIELRILASLSGDATLCEAFNKGEDIHTKTAAQIFSVPLDKVDSSQRRKAKAVNFGILYGKTAFSLAEELAISRGEAAQIIEKYFAQYPTIKGFLEGLVVKARDAGYAETLYGRRRSLPNLHAKNKMLQAMAERMAVNTPIQGTAADLIKVAMIDLSNELKKENFKAKLLLQVHDELVVEAPEEEVEALKKVLVRVMENVGTKSEFPKISVPLTVECASGKNWLDL